MNAAAQKRCLCKALYSLLLFELVKLLIKVEYSCQPYALHIYGTAKPVDAHLNSSFPELLTVGNTRAAFRIIYVVSLLVH